MIPISLPIKRNKPIRVLTASEKKLNNKNLKRYLVVYKRSQDSFLKIHGMSSIYLERHKLRVEWYYNNLEYFTAQESYVIGFSIFCKDIVGERYPYKTVEKIPVIERSKPTFDESIKSDRNIYTEEVDTFKLECSIKPNWMFDYDKLDVCGKWSGLLQSFSQNLVVPCNFKDITLQDRSELIFFLSKLFPNSYMLSINTSFVPRVYNILKKDVGAVGAIKNTDLYKCVIDSGTVYTKPSFKGKEKAFTRAPCKSLFGKKRIEYMQKNNCHLNCVYYLDRMRTARARNAIMRPYNFFKQTIFSAGGSKMFKPRTLMIIDDIEVLFDALRRFFSFTIDADICKKINFKSNTGLTNLYDKLRDKVKVFEQKGWMSLIQEMRKVPHIFDTYPSPIGPYELEDNLTIDRYIEKDRNSVEGLNTKDLMQVFKLKETIFKIKLAFGAKGRYTINKYGNVYKFVPNNVEHLLKRFVTYYGRYFLLMHINNAEDYVDTFRDMI